MELRKESFAPVIACWKQEARLEVMLSSRKAEYFRGQKNSGYIHLDGTGIIKDRLLRNNQDAARLLSSDTLNIEDFLHASGSFCLYIIRESSVDIYPDPVGIAPCYKYEDDELLACSSDIQYLCHFLQRYKKNTPFSLYYFAQILSIGNGAYGHTTHENITILPCYTYVHFTRDHVIERYYPVEDYLFGTKEPLETVLDDAAEDITRHIRVLSSSDIPCKISQLSGGFDSRLILAAMRTANVAHNFHFWTSGPSQYLEKNIAHSLIALYDLTMTNFSGLILTTPFKNIEEERLAALQYADGMTRCGVTERHQENHDAIILGGGLGEWGRAFYSQSLAGYENQDIANIGFSLWRSLLSPASARRQLLKKSIAQLINDETAKYIHSRMTACDISLQQALDIMYVEQRSRYFSGIADILFSRKVAKIAPLYSLPILKASMLVTQEERAANIVGLTLMHKLCPELLCFKFHKKKFAQLALQRFPKLDSVTLPVWMPRYDEYKKQTIETVQNKPIVTKEILQKAHAMDASPLQVAQLHTAQQGCRRLLNKYGDILDAIIDRSSLQFFVTADHTNRVDIRRTHFIYDLLCYLTNEQV